MKRTDPSGRRGQTTQDFAIGISVFLLSTAFVFAFVPSIFTPYEAEVQDSHVTQADRVASTFVGNYSVEDEPGTLDADAVKTFVENDNGGDDLRTAYNLPPTVRINVSVRTQNGSVIHELDVDGDGNPDKLARGDSYDGQPSASTSRIVTFDDANVCDPDPGNDQAACRLVVRVW